MRLTGKEIKERNPHMIALEDDREYEYIETGKVSKGIIHAEASAISTQEELNSIRKDELIVEMEKANALRDDVAWQKAYDEYQALS